MEQRIRGGCRDGGSFVQAHDIGGIGDILRGSHIECGIGKINVRTRKGRSSVHKDQRIGKTGIESLRSIRIERIVNRIFRTVHDHFRIFHFRLIQHIATGGNHHCGGFDLICTGSDIPFRAAVIFRLGAEESAGVGEGTVEPEQVTVHISFIIV